MDARPTKVNRRSVLTAAAAAGGALATQALVRPTPAAAADVVLGAINTATSETTIRNTTAANTSVAVKGVVTTNVNGGATAGVWGQSNAQGGSGVFGIALAGNSKGVWGRSADGTGVYGEATGTSGQNVGVTGVSRSADAGIGVRGTGSMGVVGEGTVAGINASGDVYGVYAISDVYGVVGFGESNSGVYAIGHTGVYGHGDEYGVFGDSDKFGVHGHGLAYGVRGEGGEFGAYLTGAKYGLYAGSAGHAGWFNGRVHVSGTLTKIAGSFLIDHPEDPANRYLEHSFVEAPERLNIYRGNVTLDAHGRATVRMPRYFPALNTEYSYQLTSIGAASPGLHIAREIEGRSFAIAGGLPNQKVCWLVSGTRRDAWARAHPLRVDRLKPRKDRGRYLTPEVHGQPASQAINRPSADVRRRPRAPQPPAIGHGRMR
jgi:hypothetical protein